MVLVYLKISNVVYNIIDNVIVLKRFGYICFLGLSII